MNDASPAGVFPIERSEAAYWNQRASGIFWSLNDFNGARRIANLARIRAWAVDIDDGDKKTQRARIESSPIIPSLIVETKRGYQAYWSAKDGQKTHWNAIVLSRLVPFFGADSNARDIARIMRVPGFYHLKDPSAPFLVREAFRFEVTYTERQMAERFAPVGLVEEEHQQHLETARRETQSTARPNGDDFWERVYNLDCAEVLHRLSGHPAVGGEQYTLRRNGSGTLNVLVNGKGTSCWIDHDGRIGSLDHGGPTAYQWLRWFRNSPRECVQVLKELFPQLEETT